jgi:hypothetical protein
MMAKSVRFGVITPCINWVDDVRSTFGAGAPRRSVVEGSRSREGGREVRAGYPGAFVTFAAFFPETA